MAHIHEKIDFTASVYIVFRNKVLLHEHKKLGILLPPGGHIELNEDPNEAVLREAKEETGLDIRLVGDSSMYKSQYAARDLVPPKFLNRHYVDLTHTHEHVDLVYFAYSESDEVQHEIPGMKMRWFTKAELEKSEELLPDIRAHALAALAELSD